MVTQSPTECKNLVSDKHPSGVVVFLELVQDLFECTKLCLIPYRHILVTISDPFCLYHFFFHNITWVICVLNVSKSTNK